ncbi:hypothetical protein [Pseudofrankia sp. DC12]|uniref:nSTAND1 domain-containing NTPase n=1 Tax=Pseudofrankia sp. DC12 TaxID=683315 RepID=UPI0012F8158A|nr:hypothetical protein [Pseudofrankia sp. DC12]
MDYDLSRLGEREFEHLSQALVLAALGPGVEVFGDGPDGGREATFEGGVNLPHRDGRGRWNGFGVVQAKYLRRPGDTASGERWFAAQVKAELEKWLEPDSVRVKKGRVPDYLLMTTNVVLSPVAGGGGVDTVDRLIESYAKRLGLRDWAVWHYDKLCRLLDVHDGVRRTNAGQIVLGDVLSQIHDLLPVDPRRRESAASAAKALLEGQSDRDAACPYKGLAAFTEADASVFFGREQLAARVVGRLSRSHAEGRPLVVMGASGAGKSSLLAAGMLPALRQGQLDVAGSEAWPRALFTPTGDPLGALAAAVAAATRRSADGLAGQLRADPDRLAAWLGEDARTGDLESPPAGADRCLLVVDQFEEVFTQCTDSAARQAFIDAICAAAACDDGSAPAAAVVIGIRADFVAHLAAFPQLRAAMEAHPVLVGPMSSDELRSAVEQPAAAAGLTLELGLVDRLIDDLGPRAGRSAGAEASYEVGQLPLLSHALLVTCQRSAGTHLTLAAYQATGGIRRAVASTADDIVARLDKDHYDTARNLLLDLVQIGEGTDDTRRRMPLARLLASAPDPQRTQRVLTELAAPDARLVTIHEDRVEITHEALLRAWPTLREWIDSDRAGQLLRQRLDDDAHAWTEGNRNPVHLYQGNRLTLAAAHGVPQSLSVLVRRGV